MIKKYFILFIFSFCAFLFVQQVHAQDTTVVMADDTIILNEKAQDEMIDDIDRKSVV